jgi:large subunit ribosomal protein L21
MFAVIKTGGKQFRVQEGDLLDIEKLEQEKGQKVTFDDVLLVEDEKNTLIGTPIVEKAHVVGEIVENFKDKKIIVFKKKRRKQYRKTSGHRQLLTKVRIEKIVLGAAAPKKEVSAAKKPKPDEKSEKIVTKPAEKKEKPEKAKQIKTMKKVDDKKIVTKKAKAEKPKATKAKEKPVRKKTPQKKTKAEKPAVKKTAAKAKKTTSKKEK